MNRVGVVSDDAINPNSGRRSRRVLELLESALTVLSAAFILLTFPFSAWMCAKVIPEYERAVIFRLGRVVKGRPKGPGLFWFIPWLDAIQTVDLRTVSFSVPLQEVLTSDGVPLQVGVVVFYRVVDPSLWVLEVRDGCQAMQSLVQTTLRAALGSCTLSDLLMLRRGVTVWMKEVLLTATSAWGAQVQRVELKDLRLPGNLQRCMASEAEAVRMSRAKMVLAEGEVKASQALMEAGSNLSPVAFHLRYLQSLSSVSSNTSVVVFSLPAELLDALFSCRP